MPLSRHPWCAPNCVQICEGQPHCQVLRGCWMLRVRVGEEAPIAVEAADVSHEAAWCAPQS